MNTAPWPPDNFIPRPEEFERAITPLLAESQAQPTAIITALQGGGGFGKTTLAQKICHDPRVEEAFPGGILWLELGQTPPLTELLNNQIQLLEKNGRFNDINAAAARLRELLADRRRTLLVLDDVWRLEHLTPFLQRGPTACTQLITTRNQDIVRAIGAQTVSVNEMALDQAVELLLKALAGEPPRKARQPLSDLAGYLGRWPLLLNLAGAYLGKLTQVERKSLPEAITRLRRRLERRGFTALDVTDAGEREKAIGLSLELSLAESGPWRERYLELAIFPEEADIPFITLEKLWGQTAGLDDLDAEDARDAMRRLSLFTRYDPERETVRLHNVIRHYLIEQQENLPALQARFLSAYRPLLTAPAEGKAAGRWADLPADEPYLWDYLAYHLTEAGLAEELYSTVTDLRYLAAKSYARTTNGVEGDLLLAQAQSPEKGLLRTLTRHFVNAAHLLNRCARLNDLQATLYSRLAHVEAMSPLSQTFATVRRPPYLTLIHPPPDLPHPALIRTLAGHTAFVWGCAFSPDTPEGTGGGRIVSASDDQTLKVWDAQTGQALLTLQGHTAAVSGCAFSPDGGRILSASGDHTLKVWDAQTGQTLLTLQGHTAAVSGCAFSPDTPEDTGGGRIVSASDDQTLKVWDAQTGQTLLTLQGHTAPVLGCAFSPDGGRILSASWDHTLKVWDVQTGQTRLTLQGHTDAVFSCAFSPDGGRILSASADQTLKVWDAQTGQTLLTLQGHTDAVFSCAFSPDGGRILSASRDYTLKVWDAQAGQTQLTLQGHTAPVLGCAFSPDGGRIVSASADQTLKVWDAQTGQAQLTLQGHTFFVSGCAFSPDGGRILSASDDHTLKVWDAQTGQTQLTLQGHTAAVLGCAFSPDEGRIVSASADQTLKVWDAQTSQTLLTLLGHTDAVLGCAFSPDGGRILSASRDYTLKVWDAQAGQTQLTLLGHMAAVFSCAFSPNGGHILSASADHTLKVWDAQTGQAQLALQGHTFFVSGCAFSPDGGRILSASRDHTLKVWDAQTGQEHLTLKGHTAEVLGCAFSPDGGRILSASDDHTLKVWDAQTGQCLATLAVEGALLDCAWSPVGGHLVAVGAAGVYFLRFVG